MRLISYALFLVGAIAVDAGIHWYLWVRLFREPAWSPNLKLAGAVALVALGLALPIGMAISRVLPRGASLPIAGSLFVWMGAAFYLVVILFALDLFRWIAAACATAWAALANEAVPTDPARRMLLAESSAKIALVGSGALSGIGLRSALADVEVKEIGVGLERLPRALSGLTIVQLSDLHVGPTIGRRFVDAIVEKTNVIRPDAIVITGDLVDGSVDELQSQVEPLGRLEARYGVYFVTGNHEYYSGPHAWIAHLGRLGIRVLRNERVPLGDDRASIDLAGIDDHSAGRYFADHGADLGRALRDYDNERELLLLAHQPRAIGEAASRGVGLQLSGHTHGGQIWPFGGFVALTQPYLAGLHRHGDRAQIYVSRGTGYWGPPMRFLAPSEITKIVLTVG